MFEGSGGCVVWHLGWLGWLFMLGYFALVGGAGNVAVDGGRCGLVVEWRLGIGLVYLRGNRVSMRGSERGL